MKNYNEMANDVLRRIEEHNIEQKRKRTVMARIVMPVCCVCLVTLLGIGLWQGDSFKTTPPITLDDSIIIGEKDYIDDKDTGDDETDGTWWIPNERDNPQSDESNSTSSENNSSKDEPTKLLCYVNQIENTISGAPKYLDPAKHYTEAWDNDKMAEYFGIDLSAINESFTYNGSDSHTVTYSNDGVLVRDIATFNYSHTRFSFIVIASKLGTPYDCIYKLDGERETNIGTDNGTVMVKFAGTVGSASEYQPEMQKLMVADFEYNGVNYRVKAENISVSDFHKIVISIVDR